MRKLRGITLIEILIAMGVSAIALAGAVLAANSQQRAYSTGNRYRAAQESARSALLYLEQKVQLAGYGMDAPLALDFGWYSPPSTSTLCPAQLQSGGACRRDRVDDSDELVFYARNPAYWVNPANPASSEPRGRAWSLVSINASSVQLNARQNDFFPQGQILQLVCSGSLLYAYFTVSTNATASTDGPLTIPLEPVVTASPFRRQDVAAGLQCASPVNATARVFQIDRYRFHVRPVGMGGGRWDPYLVLDQGVDTDGVSGVDAGDEQLIAEGIESMQVAYVFANPAIPAAGSVAGTVLTISDGTVNTPASAAQTVTTTNFPGPLSANGFVYDSSSFYKYGLVTPPPERLTNAQGNIRRVIITLVARSPDPDPTGPANLSYGTGSLLYRFNQNAAPAWVQSAAAPRGNDGFSRVVVESSLNLPNMTTRTMTFF